MISIRTKRSCVLFFILLFGVCNCYSQTARIVVNGKVAITPLFSEKNCTYDITGKLDLKGKTLIVPEGSKLLFDGGTIENGIIDLNYSKVEGSGIRCAIKHPSGNYVTASQ